MDAPTPPPPVAVVIPTFDRAGTILRAVESVLAQNYAPLDLVVVDDGSRDHTADLLSPLTQAGRLRLLRQPNRGVSAARNAGILATTAPFIAFLDSDDEWRPHKLQTQIDFFRQDPSIDLVQTQELWMRRGQRVNPGQKHRKLAGDIFIPSLSLCLISPSAVMLRRRLLDEVGLFDESLPAAEDYDLWLRILLNHPAALIDQPLVIRHGGRPDQLSAAHSLDRWRIQALEKILASPLSPERRHAASAELLRRRAIYEAGKAKREENR